MPVTHNKVTRIGKQEKIVPIYILFLAPLANHSPNDVHGLHWRAPSCLSDGRRVFSHLQKIFIQKQANKQTTQQPFLFYQKLLYSLFFHQFIYQCLYKDILLLSAQYSMLFFSFKAANKKKKKDHFHGIMCSSKLICTHDFSSSVPSVEFNFFSKIKSSSSSKLFPQHDP